MILQEPNNNDPDFALRLRMIAALAFIPPCNFGNAFERLYEVITNTYSIAADAVLNYFEDTNLGREGSAEMLRVACHYSR